MTHRKLKISAAASILGVGFWYFFPGDPSISTRYEAKKVALIVALSISSVLIVFFGVLIIFHFLKFLKEKRNWEKKRGNKFIPEVNSDDQD